MQNEILKANFLEALSKGKLCLHLTDTLPGISFSINHPLAYGKLLKAKKRPQNQMCIGLVASLEEAMKYWNPLPQKWVKALQKLWPCPLTVIAKSDHAKINNRFDGKLIDDTGYIALRYPLLTEQGYWLYDVMRQLDFPLPSTSVNLSGQPSLVTWEAAKLEAKLICHPDDLFIPEIKNVPLMTGKASTLIKIHEDGSYSLLREGSVPQDHIDQSFT